MSATGYSGKVSEPTLDRVLPHSLEAERSVLGAVLVDNAVLGTVAEKLRPEDFFGDQYRRIFGCMLEMSAAGRVIDDVTLTDYIRTKGQLEQAGGAAFLSQLSDGIPRVSNVAHYVEIIRMHGARRALLYLAERTKQSCFEAEEKPEAIAERLTADVGLLVESREGQTFRRICELTAGAPEWILEGYLEEGLTFLGAKSGVGKTWIGIAEAKALRSGEKLFGVFAVPKQRVVLYLIPEMGDRRFRTRCERLKVDTEDSGFQVMTMNDGTALPLDNPALRRYVEKHNPQVYLDTAVRFLGDKVDENASGEISRTMIKALHQLIKLGAAGVRGMHHRAKESSDEELSLENTLRGTGDFGAAAQLVWGAAHETARRAGKIEEYDALGRKKGADAQAQIAQIEREYLRKSKYLGRIYLECVKPGDRDLLLHSFRIQLRPYIDDEGAIKMLTEAPRSVEELLELNPSRSIADIAEELGISKATAWRRAVDAGWRPNGGRWAQKEGAF